MSATTPDPFDQLAGMTTTSTPIDRDFAADLRARVQRALTSGAEPSARPASSSPTTEQEPTMSTTTESTASATAESTSAATAGVVTDRPQLITPYLAVRDGTAALDWYRDHFGADVSNIVPWEGRVGHAQLDVAGVVFYLSDEAPALGVVAPEPDGSRSSVSIVIEVAAVEEFVQRAADGGATIQRPVEESYGARNAWIVDPFGHRWNVRTTVYDAAARAERRAPSEPYYMTLSSADVDRAAAFYGSVLGWEFHPQRHGGQHVVNTDMPIGLRATENPFGDTEPGEIQMWFTARDFDDAVERVRVAGGTVVELNAYDSGREAICEDDQGVTFKLSEPAPGYDR